jgi:hypothetical protein
MILAGRAGHLSLDIRLSVFCIFVLENIRIFGSRRIVEKSEMRVSK